MFWVYIHAKPHVINDGCLDDIDTLRIDSNVTNSLVPLVDIFNKLKLEYND